MASPKDHPQPSNELAITHPGPKMKQKRPQIKARSSTSPTTRNLAAIIPMSTKSPSVSTSLSSTSSSALHPSPLSPATRIISSMKKSFVVSTPKKRQPNAAASTSGMYSTPIERAPTSRYRSLSTSGTPPTVEQIAMGLHTSRTPHLRPTRTNSQPHASKTHPALPPPPARSSLKKPRTSLAESSPPPITHTLAQAQSTVSLSSATASSTFSSRHFGFKFRMGRLLSRAGSSSTAPSSSLQTPLSSSSLVSLPRKAVRFSQSVVELREPGTFSPHT